MRILAVYKHYWPDTTPYARLLRTILEHRAAEARCTVFTAQPSYNDAAVDRQPDRETLGGVDVVRCWTPPERKRFAFTRLIAAAWFLAAAVMFAWRRRRDYDVLLANVHPPVLIGLALRAIGRLTGKPFVLHMQDIHPEASAAVGVMRDNRRTRLLRRIDTANCRAAWRIVALSEDMKRTLCERDASLAPKVRVVNNFALESFEQPRLAANASERSPESSGVRSAPDRSRLNGRFRVLFAGNLGRFQNLPRLVDAAKRLDDAFEVVFMGGGLMLPELKRLAAGVPNVTFLPHAPVEAAVAEMRRSDLGVVSLSPGVCRVAYPSKCMTYLSAGLPLLALVEDDSDLAREVRDHDFGHAPGQVEGEALADAIRTAAKRTWSSEDRAALAERAGRHFGAGKALAAWDGIAEEWGSRAAGAVCEAGHDGPMRRAA